MVRFCDYISSYISIFCSTGDVKTRTLSKKRKKNKTKIGGYAVIAAKNADAFTKAREPKRIDSVADPDDDDANEEEMGPSTSIKKNDWDIVSLHRKEYEKGFGILGIIVQYIITFDYARDFFAQGSCQIGGRKNWNFDCHIETHENCNRIFKQPIS